MQSYFMYTDCINKICYALRALESVWGLVNKPSLSVLIVNRRVFGVKGVVNIARFAEDRKYKIEAHILGVDHVNLLIL